MDGRPVGITIIAIVLAFGGVLQILTGTEALGVTSFGLTAVTDAAGISGWSALVSGVLTVLVAGGLFTTAGWAWLLTVAVMAIRIVVDLFAMMTHGVGSSLRSAALGSIVISVIVLWYFLRPNVRAAFGR